MKIKCILLGFVSVFCTLALFSQASINIFDPFYEDLTIWENIGIINDAPQVRPYPLQEIKRLLTIVQEKGDALQQKKAKDYYNRFFNRVFHFGARSDIALSMPNLSRELSFQPFVDINYEITDILTISANGGPYITNKLPSNEPLPTFQYSKKDLAADGVHVGPFDVLPMINSGITIGTPEYYFSAGFARTSSVPFHDTSIFVGKHATHQGQFNFVINKELWNYNHTFLTLAATNDFNRKISPGKFLSIHSLTVRPLSWLSVGIVDSVIYGGRLEPIYFIPFSAFFMSQGLFSFPDNSLIGFNFTVKPLAGLRIDGAVYADDMGFNELVRFKSAKARLSSQLGISYTMPESHWFSFINLDYTIVTPYTYTHYDNIDTSMPNYQNYMHNGVPLGSNLEPNSDRFHLKAKFRPVEGLDIDIFNTFIRHGNVVESIEEYEVLKDYLSKGSIGNPYYPTDGSTLNPSAVFDKNGHSEHAFLKSTPFLAQQTIQYVNQLGLDVSAHLPILKSGGHMLFKLGYVFEVNINPRVGTNIYGPCPDGLAGLWGTKTWVGMLQSEKDKVIKNKKEQLEKWRAAARGKEFNHYIRLSMEVSY